jgi:hypothetical protein
LRSAAARCAAACPAPLGGIVRLAAASRGQRRGRDGFICGVCCLRGARQSGRSVRVRARGTRGTRRARRAGTALGAVFGARGQNLDCVDVVKAAPVARGECQLVGEQVYQALIDGRDDRMFHKRGFIIE